MKKDNFCKLTGKLQQVLNHSPSDILYDLFSHSISPKDEVFIFVFVCTSDFGSAMARFEFLEHKDTFIFASKPSERTKTKAIKTTNYPVKEETYISKDIHVNRRGKKPKKINKLNK